MDRMIKISFYFDESFIEKWIKKEYLEDYFNSSEENSIEDKVKFLKGCYFTLQELLEDYGNEVKSEYIEIIYN